MADNSPSIKEWKELYQKATEFKKLKPWEWMWDEQIFAVKNPETGETAYCTVMGRMQSFYGMAAYLGPEGLENYCDIQSGRITPDDPDAFFQQRVLVVSFEDRDDIEDEDYQIIRKLGLRFRGKNQWPLFRSFRPHYMPWYLDGDEARFLTLILEQAIIVGQGIKEDPELLTPPVLGKIFTRIPDHKGEWKDSWTDPTDDEGCVSESNDEEESISKVNMGEVSLPDKVTDELKKMKKQGTWEVDLFYYPEAVQEGSDERPYFPAVITWADHERGDSLEVELAEPSQWKSLFLETFHQAVTKTQHLPQTILYENEELFPLLEITTKMGVKLDEVYELEVLGQVKQGIMDSAGENNPVLEAMELFIPEESLEKLLELIEEDENIATLIQKGDPDALLENEKIQAFLKEELALRGYSQDMDSLNQNSVPSSTRSRGERKPKKDKTQQTFFQTDAGTELSKVGKSIYQFRIDLEGIRPPIWRRILVPGDSTLKDLHKAIQDVMGWEDYHLHEFQLPDPFSGNRISLDNSQEDNELIEDWFDLENPRGRYIYDFGDYWEHIIKLEKIQSLDEGAAYPQCTGGKRASPPEDCGGVGGYQEMLEILKDPEHEEYEETVEWLGDNFDPEEFNPEAVVFRGLGDS